MQRMTLCVTLLVILMTLSLIVGTVSWGDTGKIELKQKGYKLDAPAYVVPVSDGRDTVELIETQAAELTALREYLVAQNASLEQIADAFNEFEVAFGEERKAWQNEAAKLRKRNERLASPWAVGFFGGYDPFREEAVCGVGITYSVVRF